MYPQGKIQGVVELGNIHNLVKPGLSVVIYGAMMGGKSKELISIAQQLKYRYGEESIRFFKPESDDRNGPKIWSRFTNITYPATFIPDEEPTRIFDYISSNNPRIVGIDEAQFFSGLTDVVEALVKKGYGVVLAGLNTDFKREDFGEMPSLISTADIAIPSFGQCTYEGCEETGKYTQRLKKKENLWVPAHYNDKVKSIEIIDGEPQEKYVARCLKHHELPGKDLDEKIYEFLIR